MIPPYALVANEGSGRRDRERLAHLRDTLCRTLSAPVAWHPVRRGRELRAAVASIGSAGGGTVFVAGGDGTISAVADAIKGSRTVLAPIPAGTFNFFARGLGLPDDPDQAIAALAGGQTVALPVAEVNGRLFLNNASIGLYPAILAERERIYHHWGRSRPAAYWSVLKTVLRGGHRMRLPLTVDGERREVRTSMIFVGASAYQLEHFRLAGAEAVRQGRLVAFFSGDRSRFGLLSAAARLALGLPPGEQSLEATDGSELVIGAPNRSITVALDGERFRMRGPLRMRIRPRGLRVLVPTAAAAAQAA